MPSPEIVLHQASIVYPCIYSALTIELYMRLLQRQDEEVDFDPVLFALFVDKVIVCGTKRDVRLRFVLAGGSEWKA